MSDDSELERVLLKGKEIEKELNVEKQLPNFDILKMILSNKFAKDFNKEI